jgi:hypothetical protein
MGVRVCIPPTTKVMGIQQTIFMRTFNLKEEIKILSDIYYYERIIGRYKKQIKKLKDILNKKTEEKANGAAKKNKI